MAPTVGILDTGDDDLAKRWETYVLGQPQATGYHGLGWKRVLEQVYGYRTYYLYAKDGKDLVGILPLARVGAPLLGRALISLPFTSYGGIVADTTDVAAELFESAAGLARRLGAGHVELRHFERTLLAAPTKTHKVTMWLDLPSSVDSLWKAFPTALRTDVRKRIKDGLEVRIGGEELDSFYRVYTINMRDLGTPVYPKAFFTTILAEWPGSAWIATCVHRGEAVASGFLLGFRGTLEIPWASSLKSRKNLRPNMLLYWECLRHAIGSGFTRFDFGRSTQAGGTYAFKSQWGARAVPLYWQYWLARGGGQLPDLSRENPRFTAAIRAWQRLPLWLTRLVGPRLAPYFP